MYKREATIVHRVISKTEFISWNSGYIVKLAIF